MQFPGTDGDAIELSPQQQEKVKSSAGEPNTYVPSVQKKTMSQLAQESGTAGRRKDVRALDEETLNQWEMIDGAFHFRSAVIAANKDTEKGSTQQLSQEPLSQMLEEASQDINASEQKGGDEVVPEQESERAKELEHAMESCPLRDIAKMAEELPPVQYTIRSRPNDLTPQEKLALQQMAGAHGYPQRPENTIPFSRRIYRCGWEGCRATLNPNGVEKATRSHFRKMHKTHPRAIQITLDRHDGKQMSFLIPRGAKSVSEKPVVGQPKPAQSPIDPHQREKAEQPESPNPNAERLTLENYEGHLELDVIGTPERVVDGDEPEPQEQMPSEEGDGSTTTPRMTKVKNKKCSSKETENLPATAPLGHSESHQLDYLRVCPPNDPTSRTATVTEDETAAERLGPTEDVPHDRQPRQESGPDGTGVFLPPPPFSRIVGPCALVL